MIQNMITPNETLQLQELLTLKSLSLTKSVVMSPLITDPDLKAILQKDSGACEGHIRDLARYMDRAPSAYNSGAMKNDSRGAAL